MLGVGPEYKLATLALDAVCCFARSSPPRLRSNLNSSLRHKLQGVVYDILHPVCVCMFFVFVLFFVLFFLHMEYTLSVTCQGMLSSSLLFFVDNVKHLQLLAGLGHTVQNWHRLVVIDAILTLL